MDSEALPATPHKSLRSLERPCFSGFFFGNLLHRSYFGLEKIALAPSPLPRCLYFYFLFSDRFRFRNRMGQLSTPKSRCDREKLSLEVGLIKKDCPLFFSSWFDVTLFAKVRSSISLVLRNAKTNRVAEITRLF